jgi:tetratricopeptide (TPR) repeat protein
MQRSLWGFGTLVALAFLIALYFAPGHLGLDKLIANNRFNQGVMHDGKGEIDTAIDFYDRAIRRNPDLVDAYNNRGADRRRQGNLEAAIADFSEVIRLRPNDSAGYYNRATTYLMAGNVQQALADYDPAIRHASDYAAWLKQHRKPGVNFAEMTAISRAEESVVRARLARGRLLLDQNALDDAAADFSAVLNSSNTDGRVGGATNLIRIDLLKSNFDAAVSRLRAYAEKNPGDPAGGFFSGFAALFHDNDPRRAATIFQKALTEGFRQREYRAMMNDAFPGDPGPWLGYGLLFKPHIYQLIVWQHVARQRAGDDDRSEFQDSLRQLGAALKGADLLTGAVSAQNMTASRVEWPGPVIDLFLGLKTPEQLAAIATAATDAFTPARRKCDVDFYSGLLALNTKSPEARAMLERAAANCPANALEGVAAKLELGRM